MSVQEEIIESVAEVIEPNLQFYRQDASDNTRYFVGPEAIHFIASVVTSIALPILLGAANVIVGEEIKEWRKKSKAENKPVSQLPQELQDELARILETREDIVITKEKTDEAIVAVGEYLSERGWPKVLATSDATQIIELIRKHGEEKS